MGLLIRRPLEQVYLLALGCCRRAALGFDKGRR